MIPGPHSANRYGLMLIPWWTVKMDRDQAFQFIEMRETWAFRHGCVLQANDGCGGCDPEDYGLDWCPFFPEHNPPMPRGGDGQ